MTARAASLRLFLRETAQVRFPPCRRLAPPHLLLGRLLGLSQHRLKLVDEVMHVLELAIDAREADVCDLIHVAEVLHDEFADFVGRHFRVEAIVDFAFDGFDERTDLFVADGAFPAGFF